MHPVLEHALVVTRNRITANNSILQFKVRPGNELFEEGSLLSYGLCELQQKDLQLAKMIYPPHWVISHFNSCILRLMGSPFIITQVHQVKDDDQDLRIFGAYIKDGNNNLIGYYVENYNNRLTATNKAKLFGVIISDCSISSCKNLY